jgi:hypothetical protein
MNNIKILFYCLCIALLFLSSDSFSQNGEQNTPAYKDKYNYKVSAKFGYHDKDNEGINYFPGSWIGDLSIQRKIAEHWSVGPVAEYWQTTADIEHSNGYYYTTHFKAYQIALQVFFISAHKFLDVSIGAVAGKYTIHYEYSRGTSTDNYLNIGFLFSPEYRLSKRFSVAAEVSYYRLVNSQQHASLFNFKLGPAFRF